MNKKRLDIISINNHRINEYMADRAMNALALDYDISRLYREESDAILMTNGVGMSEEAREAIESGKPILYLHDELASTIPPVPNLTVASQYIGLGEDYFQVSSLAIFDTRFDFRQTGAKFYDFIYWGHPKPGRDKLYSMMPDDEDALYIGEFDKPNSHTMDYIRNPDVLMIAISTGTRTYVDGSDFDNDHGNIPLRVFEALMNGVIPDSLGYTFSNYKDAYAYYIGDKQEYRFEVSKKLKELVDEYCK